MNLKRKSKIILFQFWSSLIVLFLSRQLAASVGADPALSLADSLYQWQNYQEAITEYQRFIFFNPEDERVGYAYYKIGLAYRSEGQWPEAIEALKISVQKTRDDSLAEERRIISGTTLIASGSPSAALLELFKVSQFSRYPTLRSRALFFQGVAYLYLFNWDAAHQAFKESWSNKEQFVEADKVDSLLLTAQKLRYKSVTKAQWFSTFLPGLGQMYAGRFWNGLNALVLNGLTTAWFLSEILKQDYVDASIVFLGILRRYYQGNRYHAREFVEQYNRKLEEQKAREVLQALLGQ